MRYVAIVYTPGSMAARTTVYVLTAPSVEEARTQIQARVPNGIVEHCTLLDETVDFQQIVEILEDGGSF